MPATSCSAPGRPQKDPSWLALYRGGAGGVASMITWLSANLKFCYKFYHFTCLWVFWHWDLIRKSVGRGLGRVHCPQCGVPEFTVFCRHFFSKFHMQICPFLFFFGVVFFFGGARKDPFPQYFMGDGRPLVLRDRCLCRWGFLASVKIFSREVTSSIPTPYRC